MAHFNQVKKTFGQIDKLESAVRKVEKSVSAMETELNTAEAYLESESVFKTVFKPFLVAHLTPKPIPVVALFQHCVAETFQSHQPGASCLQACRHIQSREPLGRKRFHPTRVE